MKLGMEKPPVVKKSSPVPGYVFHRFRVTQKPKREQLPIPFPGWEEGREKRAQGPRKRL